MGIVKTRRIYWLIVRMHYRKNFITQRNEFHAKLLNKNIRRPLNLTNGDQLYTDLLQNTWDKSLPGSGGQSTSVVPAKPEESIHASNRNSADGEAWSCKKTLPPERHSRIMGTGQIIGSIIQSCRVPRSDQRHKLPRMNPGWFV
jgi:hypothetical protein